MAQFSHEQTIRILSRELRAYAHVFRHAEFLDGRTVRDQLNMLAAWADRSCGDSELEEFTAGTEWAAEVEEG